MLSVIFEKVGRLFERAERRRRDDYLSASVDVEELEMRMRHIERNGYSLDRRYSGQPYDIAYELEAHKLWCLLRGAIPR